MVAISILNDLLYLHHQVVRAYVLQRVPRYRDSVCEGVVSRPWDTARGEFDERQLRLDRDRILAAVLPMIEPNCVLLVVQSLNSVHSATRSRSHISRLRFTPETRHRAGALIVEDLEVDWHVSVDIRPVVVTHLPHGDDTKAHDGSIEHIKLHASAALVGLKVPKLAILIEQFETFEVHLAGNRLKSIRKGALR